MWQWCSWSFCAGKELSMGSQQASFSKKIQAESSEKATMVIHQASDILVVMILISGMQTLILFISVILWCMRCNDDDDKRTRWQYIGLHWIRLDLTELAWIPQASPNWSTPPAMMMIDKNIRMMAMNLMILDPTGSHWIPQALPNWSTPPASGWSSQCR